MTREVPRFMNPERFGQITHRYPQLRLAVVGDFCLDRYLEIDPDRREQSIETGLPVHNVVRVRSQPGGAGTILNNLVALGIGRIHPVGFCGEDGEGYELQRALRGLAGIDLTHLVVTAARRTFTYCKPLVIQPGKAPVELNRLDSKNWSPTPREVEARLISAVQKLVPEVDGVILLDQVDAANTGVVTGGVLEAVGAMARAMPHRFMVADSRRGLRGFPAVSFKMNAAELALLSGTPVSSELEVIQRQAMNLARHNQRPVFVTLAERGIVAAAPEGRTDHVPALPLRGEIDVVGAGDAVTANLTAAIAAGATLREAIQLANAAASVVIHQLGTTGTASVAQLAELLP